MIRSVSYESVYSRVYFPSLEFHEYMPVRGYTPGKDYLNKSVTYYNPPAILAAVEAIPVIGVSKSFVNDI